MTGFPKRWAFALMILLLSCFWACAGSRTFYVTPRYSGQPAERVAGMPVVGMQALTDRRLEKPDYLGMRFLGRGRRETYLTGTGSLAGDLSAMLQAYAGARGYAIRDVAGWDFAPEALAALGSGLQYVVGGEIKTLNADAVRRLGRSELVLTVEVVFYVGDVAAARVTRRPVKMRIERIEAVFDAPRLERHLNAVLAETIATGLQELP
ncbi:MAG: hypothetical protein R6X05_11895 [Desulfobacterales bacterium]|jgi:hypothetical protein